MKKKPRVLLCYAISATMQEIRIVPDRPDVEYLMSTSGSLWHRCQCGCKRYVIWRVM